MSGFQNQFCACSVQPVKKYESGLLFNTNMPEPLQFGYYVIVRGTDKCYINCLNEDNYVTVWFIVRRNIEIMPQNQCFQVPIVEGTGSRSGGMCKLSRFIPREQCILEQAELGMSRSIRFVQSRDRASRAERSEWRGMTISGWSGT